MTRARSTILLPDDHERPRARGKPGRSDISVWAISAVDETVVAAGHGGANGLQISAQLARLRASVARLTLERERPYTPRSVSRLRDAFVCAQQGTLRHGPEALPAVGSRAWRRGAVHEPPSAVPGTADIKSPRGSRCQRSASWSARAARRPSKR